MTRGLIHDWTTRSDVRPLLAIAAGLVLIVVRWLPVPDARLRRLSVIAPLVFGLAIWISPSVAASAACWAFCVNALLADEATRERRLIAVQGASLSLAAAAAGKLWPVATRTLGAHGAHTWPSGPSAAYGLVAAATAAAIAFTVVLAVLLLASHVGHLSRLFRDYGRRSRLTRASMSYGIGMAPVVILSPLCAEWGMRALLPLAFAALVCYQLARLTLRTAWQQQQLGMIARIGQAAAADTGGDRGGAAALEEFLTLTRSVVAADHALIWELDRETDIFTPTVAVPGIYGFVAAQAKLGEGIVGAAAARIRPRLIADSAVDPRRSADELPGGSWLLYPLFIRDRVIGVAHWIRSSDRPFAPRDIARLDALTHQAAMALDNAQTRARMMRLADTDSLTELWNHRRTHEILRDEVRRAGRYHRPFSVLMLDVDSFKEFNDSYGHPQGDRLLREIAKVLAGNVRTTDSVGRYGGEEFLVVLPETPKDAACHLAERIRLAVESHAGVAEGADVVRRTVSVGVASYPEDALGAVELVQRADEALYRAKQAGKNRVLWA